MIVVVDGTRKLDSATRAGPHQLRLFLFGMAPHKYCNSGHFLYLWASIGKRTELVCVMALAALDAAEKLMARLLPQRVIGNRGAELGAIITQMMGIASDLEWS